MLTGVITFFDVERGFGFILPDDRAEAVFVHISQMKLAGMYEGATSNSKRSPTAAPNAKGGGKLMAVGLRPLSLARSKPAALTVDDVFRSPTVTMRT